MKFWTYTLSSGSLSINSADGAMFVSIQTSSAGGCNVTGGIAFKELPSNPVSLSAGGGVNFSAKSPASPLDGLTIDWVAGTVDVVIGF
jgi:hypothetical protein